MAKNDDTEMKHQGSEAMKALQSMKKGVEDAMKTSLIAVKNPNPKVMEALADQLESVIEDSAELKGMLKDIKALAK